jgi:hypothetical protein
LLERRDMRFLLASALAVAALGALLATPACESDDDECCPVSESFNCNSFDQGGARSLQPGAMCATKVPDAFPVKKTRSIDAKGCPYWEPDTTATGRCGQAARRPTTDASSDAPDASDDATDATDASDDASDASDASSD